MTLSLILLAALVVYGTWWEYTNRRAASYDAAVDEALEVTR